MVPVKLQALAGAVLVALAGCASPKPVKVVFLLDSSKSSQPILSDAIATIKGVSDHMIKTLDRVSVYHMGRTVYSIYNGGPKDSNLTVALDKYSSLNEIEVGTAYGNGLTRGLQDVDLATRKGYDTTLVIMGDGADEPIKGGGNINWETLPKEFSQYPKTSTLAFLFVEPKWSDRFEQALLPTLDDRLMIVTSAIAGDGHAIRMLRNRIHR